MIYLDYSANTPVDPRVLEVYCRTEQNFIGNPNSTHCAGQAARQEMNRVTGLIAAQLGVLPEEIIYTSGATEANNLALKGMARAARHVGRHIISTPLEHSSVGATLTALQQQGYEIDLLNIGRDGRIDLEQLEELLRKIRPYELEPGSADAAFDKSIDAVIGGLRQGGIGGMKKGFKKAIASMLSVKYDRSKPRPTVLIVGEYLLNFHPGANHDMELYLENNGLEIIEARMTDVIRKTYFYQRSQQREYKVHRPLPTKLNNSISDAFFKLAHDATDKIAKAHPLYTPPCRMPELVQASDPIIHHTFDAGEGVLIPAEILHHAKRGCRAFVILQPFGCLPNHVVGRGISKRLKELYPDAQILPLDFDPDVSFANIENRLQMLIMNARKPRTS